MIVKQLQVWFLLTALEDFLQIDLKNCHSTISPIHMIHFPLALLGQGRETRWPIMACPYDSGSTGFEIWPEPLCLVHGQDISTLVE